MPCSFFDIFGHMLMFWPTGKVSTSSPKSTIFRYVHNWQVCNSDPYLKVLKNYFKTTIKSTCKITFLKSSLSEGFLLSLFHCSEILTLSLSLSLFFTHYLANSLPPLCIFIPHHLNPSLHLPPSSFLSLSLTHSFSIFFSS